MFYYATDGSTFQSKVKALEYQKTTGNRVFYYYYDHVYSKLNWKLEPSETLDELYKQQAIRLREKYDYLILLYSGGYDSTNILETFHFNGIKLDKIVMVGAFGQDSRSGVDENHNGELYLNAFPYLEELGLTGIAEKIDYTELFSKVDSTLSVYQYGSEWVDLLGGWFSPHNWFWRDAEKYIIPKNIGSKKVGLIFGKDKPSILSESRFSFNDTPINSYGNVFGTEISERINFYWDPEFPQILIKQLHVLKRVRTNGLSLGYDHAAGAQTLGGVQTNKIIYNLRRPLVFKSPKSKSNLISLRDSYLARKMNSAVYDCYISGIRDIQKRVSLDVVKPLSTRTYEI